MAKRTWWLLVAAAQTAAAGAAGGATAEGMCVGLEVHAWFESHYEYFHLENWILAVLVVFAMIFEYVWHHLTHGLRHAGMHHHETVLKEHHEAIAEGDAVDLDDSHTSKQASLKAVAKDFEEEVRLESKSLYTTLAQRCAGELMILGFLAWVVWSCARSGLFHKLACDVIVSHINLPSHAHGYLETVEDVHMHLFLTMVAFIAILTLGVHFLHRKMKIWQKMDIGILKAVRSHDERELKEFCPEGINTQSFIQFFKSRRLLFGRLAYAMANREAHLSPIKMDLLWEVLEDILEHKHPGATFKAEDIPSILDEWFSFSAYVKLMCHNLMEDLTEIKVGTWLYLCSGLIASALLIVATQTVKVHAAVIVIQLLVALGLGLFMPVYLYRQHAEELISGSRLSIKRMRTDDMEKEGEQIEPILLPHVRLPKFWHFEDFPMFTLQMFIFFGCYNIVRVVAANYWWHEETEIAIVLLAVLFITIPLVGYLVGRSIAALSIFLSRGDVVLQDENLAWIYHLSAAHLTKIRRRARRKARADSKASKSQPDEAHPGVAQDDPAL